MGGRQAKEKGQEADENKEIQLEMLDSNKPYLQCAKKSVFEMLPVFHPDLSNLKH